MGSQPHASATPIRDRTDALITASIRGLAAAMEIPAEELAELAGVHRTTYYRRKRAGGWKAAEVAAIARRFRVPVGDLYSGRVTVVVGPDDDPQGSGLVRHEGFEPPTRWFDGRRRRGHLAVVNG